MFWTSTPPASNARVAALISDAFARAVRFDPRHVGAAPRDVATALRFAMQCDAGAFLEKGAA